MVGGRARISNRTIASLPRPTSAMIIVLFASAVPARRPKRDARRPKKRPCATLVARSVSEGSNGLTESIVKFEEETDVSMAATHGLSGLASLACATGYH